MKSQHKKNSRSAGGRKSAECDLSDKATQAGIAQQKRIQQEGVQSKKYCGCLGLSLTEIEDECPLKEDTVSARRLKQLHRGFLALDPKEGLHEMVVVHLACGRVVRMLAKKRADGQVNVLTQMRHPDGSYTVSWPDQWLSLERYSDVMASVMMKNGEERVSVVRGEELFTRLPHLFAGLSEGSVELARRSHNAEQLGKDRRPAVWDDNYQAGGCTAPFWSCCSTEDGGDLLRDFLARGTNQRPYELIVRHYDDGNVWGVLTKQNRGTGEIEALDFVWNVRGIFDYIWPDDPISIPLHKEAFTRLTQEHGLENVSVYRGQEIFVRLQEWARAKRGKA